jgi:hypothetical protein
VLLDPAYKAGLAQHLPVNGQLPMNSKAYNETLFSGHQ